MLLLLIGHILLAAKRRWKSDVLVSGLAAVLVLSISLLMTKAADEVAPREEIYLALLR